jgi:hypothetical protein
MVGPVDVCDPFRSTEAFPSLRITATQGLAGSQIQANSVATDDQVLSTSVYCAQTGLHTLQLVGDASKAVKAKSDFI